MRNIYHSFRHWIPGLHWCGLPRTSRYGYLEEGCHSTEALGFKPTYHCHFCLCFLLMVPVINSPLSVSNSSHQVCCLLPATCCLLPYSACPDTVESTASMHPKMLLLSFDLATVLHHSNEKVTKTNTNPSCLCVNYTLHLPRCSQRWQVIEMSQVAIQCSPSQFYTSDIDFESSCERRGGKCREEPWEQPELLSPRKQFYCR